jgi:hypothetical protein
MSRNEFQEITVPALRKLNKDDFVTMPLPGGRKAEIKVNMHAFERFDIVGFRWKDKKMDTFAVESKIVPEEAIPQALIYQTYIPEVYIASNQSLSQGARELLKWYGIGFMRLDGDELTTEIESKPSPLFNVDLHQREIVPKGVAILGFMEFMKPDLARTNS